MARPNPRPKVEIAFMETVTINHKPAQNRMQLPDNPLNALTHPRNPGICPACSHMKHKDVLLASACGKARKSVAPETNSIQKSHRHGGAFIRNPRCSRSIRSKSWASTLWSASCNAE